MSLVEEYEKQYSNLIAEITSQIALNGDGNRFNAPKISDKIDEANELLEQIGLEIGQDTSSSAIGRRYKCYEVELKRLREDFNRQRRVNDFPDSLSIDDDDYDGTDQQRLLDNSERLERSGKKLTEGYKIVIETENVANQLLQNLSGQRDTIQRARARVRDADADLHRSNRIANTMILRSIREKALLYAIGIIFVIVIIVAIYLSLHT